MISGIISFISGALIAIAILLIGPVETSVTSPGFAFTVSMIRSTASNLDNGIFGSGRKASACPSFPCVNGSLGLLRIIGFAIPRATGMSVLFSSSNTFLAFTHVTSTG